ncbi:MAG: hypothetical protein RIR18_104 [Pseudomonadota bacterium]|jgi:hypothetical protein
MSKITPLLTTKDLRKEIKVAANEIKLELRYFHQQLRIPHLSLIENPINLEKPLKSFTFTEVLVREEFKSLLRPNMLSALVRLDKEWLRQVQALERSISATESNELTNLRSDLNNLNELAHQITSCLEFAAKKLP